MTKLAHVRRVVIVGLGNIGSFAAAAVARISELAFVLLVDPDTYEEENLKGQGITHGDIGKRKVDVMRRWLLRINPQLKVEVFADVVKKLPLGLLGSSIVLGCLDSREARRDLSQACWRMGVDYIDAGVQADGLLARVNVYVPSRHSPCFVCGWSQEDYESLPQRHPCDGNGSGTGVPTNAWAILGQLAASYQVIECQKLITGGPGRVLDGMELMVDGAHHRHTVTEIRRSPSCRFDHEVWKIERLDRGPRDLTLAQAFALPDQANHAKTGFAKQKHRSDGNVALRVPGHVFAENLMCVQCGHSEPAHRWVIRPPLSDQPHKNCSVEPKAHLMPRSFEATEQLMAGRMPSPLLSRSLHRLGLEAHDVFAVGFSRDGRAHPVERFFQLGIDQKPKRTPGGDRLACRP